MPPVWISLAAVAAGFVTMLVALATKPHCAPWHGCPGSRRRVAGWGAAAMLLGLLSAALFILAAAAVDRAEYDGPTDFRVVIGAAVMDRSTRYAWFIVAMLSLALSSLTAGVLAILNFGRLGLGLALFAVAALAMTSISTDTVAPQ